MRNGECVHVVRPRPLGTPRHLVTTVQPRLAAPHSASCQGCAHHAVVPTGCQLLAATPGNPWLLPQEEPLGQCWKAKLSLTAPPGTYRPMERSLHPRRGLAASTEPQLGKVTSPKQHQVYWARGTTEMLIMGIAAWQSPGAILHAQPTPDSSHLGRITHTQCSHPSW